jgi:hypothetical protein
MGKLSDNVIEYWADLAYVILLECFAKNELIDKEQLCGRLGISKTILTQVMWKISHKAAKDNLFLCRPSSGVSSYGYICLSADRDDAMASEIHLLKHIGSREDTVLKEATLDRLIDTENDSEVKQSLIDLKTSLQFKDLAHRQLVKVRTELIDRLEEIAK